MPVCVHHPRQLAKAGESEPKNVVDVAEHVHQGDGDGDAEDVEVELSGLAGALVVEAVHIAHHCGARLQDGLSLPDHVD